MPTGAVGVNQREIQRTSRGGSLRSTAKGRSCCAFSKLQTLYTACLRGKFWKDSVSIGFATTRLATLPDNPASSVPELGPFVLQVQGAIWHLTDYTNLTSLV